MDDLTCFALAWAGLLALVVIAAITRPLARRIVAYLLARAIREITRPD